MGCLVPVDLNKPQWAFNSDELAANPIRIRLICQLRWTGRESGAAIGPSAEPRFAAVGL